MIAKLTLFLWLRLLLLGYFSIRFYTNYDWPPSLGRKPFIGLYHDYYDGYIWVAWIGRFAIEGTPGKAAK